ncbi:MAG: M20/M25/M40 family metallo-hydrolase, partial [Chloroflexota bacterium]|nr:M20/M25/M40 family metallo-hydrolase [Chloroflexota bacterium]
MAKHSLVIPSSAVPRRAVSVTRSHLDRAKLARGVLLLALLLAVAAGMFQFSTPPVAPLTAPPTEFSAARAMQHLQVIAREPHPIGSAANERVRDYLVTQLRALGLEPEVQTATAGRDLYFGARLGAVQNVIARLKGTQPGKGIMLAAHYDSVPSSPGASDDGAAVAAMLETARALNVGTPLQHDVILLFTDGEEVGLLGARAFVDEHPWAKDVGLALNFEARGSRGPAVMFETSSGNSRLIDEFAQATPYPVAYSFVYSIYQLLPNDTDLTMFKDLHTQSLNFGYVFDWPAYHSMRDTVETIDPRSLQHHGSHMLALTQHFGNRAFAQPSERDAVFFTLAPGMLVHYSEVWVLPLAVAVTLLFAGVLAFGLRRNLLTVGGLVGGFFACLLNAVLSLVAVTLAWWAIQQLNANYRVLLNGTTYETTLYLLAFIALIAAILSGLSVLFLRKVRVENLAMGALGIWTILMLLTSIALPGFSYLFTWPLL